MALEHIAWKVMGCRLEGSTCRSNSLAPLFALGFDFFFCSIMNPNIIGCPRCVCGTSLAPIVTAGIGKELPLRIEGRARNASLNRIKRLEPLLVVYFK